MVNVVTEEDLKRVEAKLDRVLMELENLKNQESKLITAQDIIIRMNIGYRTFQRKVPELKKYGLKKIGGIWQMKEVEFNTYIDSI